MLKDFRNKPGNTMGTDVPFFPPLLYYQINTIYPSDYPFHSISMEFRGTAGLCCCGISAARLPEVILLVFPLCFPASTPSSLPSRTLNTSSHLSSLQCCPMIPHVFIFGLSQSLFCFISQKSRSSACLSFTRFLEIEIEQYMFFFYGTDVTRLSQGKNVNSSDSV